MTDRKEKLERLGLPDIDDENIKSTEDIINYVSSSGRLFRTTLQNLILKDIQLYFNNPDLTPDDRLRDFFPRKRIRFEWITFTNYFSLINFKVPSLKPTRLTVIILTIYALSFFYFTYWLLFIQFDLVIHMMLSKVALIPISLVVGWYLGTGVYLLGELKPPTETFEQLIDKIINKNISHILAEDKKQFKELMLKELVN